MATLTLQKAPLSILQIGCLPVTLPHPPLRRRHLSANPRAHSEQRLNAEGKKKTDIKNAWEKRMI